MNSKFLCCLAAPGNKGFCVPLSARRSLRPAHDAAATLLRFREDACDAAGCAPAAPAAPDGGSAAGAYDAEVLETDERAPLEPREAPGVPRQRTVSEPAGTAAAQGRAAWADAAGGGGAAGAATPPRRIRSYPLALGAEGTGGLASPDPDAKSASSERQAGGSAPGTPAPWTGGPRPAGGGALLGSSAHGLFSELRRSGAQKAGPERAVELSPAGPPADGAGLRTGGGAAFGRGGQVDSGGGPRGATAGDVHGAAGSPEGLRGLRVLGVEAHSRCARPGLRALPQKNM
jgi:hypothetical protein